MLLSSGVVVKTGTCAWLGAASKVIARKLRMASRMVLSVTSSCCAVKRKNCRLIQIFSYKLPLMFSRFERSRLQYLAALLDNIKLIDLKIFQLIHLSAKPSFLHRVSLLPWTQPERKSYIVRRIISPAA